MRPSPCIMPLAAVARLAAVALLAAAVPATPLDAQAEPELPPQADYLIPAGVASGLPLVEPNDNTVPAGTTVSGVREISLEVVRADWRVETPGGPGLRVAAVRETGGAPMIPAPLIRVEEGTMLRVTVHNDLDEAITVFGLHTRPAVEPESFEVAPGAASTVEFEAGAPGTYFYGVLMSSRIPASDGSEEEQSAPLGEREQLAGALVVDPAGGSPEDRVLVINIFSQPVVDVQGEDSGLEGLAINGRSWPYTELMRMEVGETQRWRVVNASGRFHPMHLHGFFYSVMGRGTMTTDTLYDAGSDRLVVTEPMPAGTTMLMEWTPTREGRWLFHCHLSFHVWAEQRLPGAVEADAEHAHSHMAGLVLGIEVAPGPTDLVAEGEPVELELFANEYGDADGFRYGFSFDEAARPDTLSESPGPVLVFNQFQAAHVTVRNEMSIPTSVHWHGLELDGWADGVPEWSASEGRMSPTVPPGESFTYRLSMLRPGTFIYHSHLDDVHQLAGGLHGPLIVLPPGESFDPRTDHVMLWSWRAARPSGPMDFELNGRHEQPDAEAIVGETHRFRVIHIAPAGRVTAFFTRDGEPVPITPFAKDGADLPQHQRVPVDQLARLGVGETADFTWTPTEPGVYELRLEYPNPAAGFTQRWVVRPAGD